MKVVRPTIRRSRAVEDDGLRPPSRWTTSARPGCRIGASFRKARATLMRWRSPPESWGPRSPSSGLVLVRQAA